MQPYGHGGIDQGSQRLFRKRKSDAQEKNKEKCKKRRLSEPGRILQNRCFSTMMTFASLSVVHDFIQCLIDLYLLH